METPLPLLLTYHCFWWLDIQTLLAQTSRRSKVRERLTMEDWKTRRARNLRKFVSLGQAEILPLAHWEVIQSATVQCDH